MSQPGRLIPNRIQQQERCCETGRAERLRGPRSAERGMRSAAYEKPKSGMRSVEQKQPNEK
jgi:hypothetical protein